MEPNGKFYTQYPQQPQHAQQPPKRPRGKAILLTLLALLLIGGAGAGAYFYQQSRIDALNNEKNQLNQQLTEAASKATEEEVLPNQFSYPKAPFTFSYPSNWTLSSEQSVTSNEELPENYTINLLAPGTVEAASLIGSQVVVSESGAKITIAKTKATDTDIRKILGALAEMLKLQFKDVTVGGVAGVEYEFAYESPRRISTAFVKDGAVYYISFDAEDDANLTKNEYYKNYEQLVKSFAFK